MALAVGPFLFWGFLGQLYHATRLLQGCYLVLMRKCVLLLQSPPPIAAGLRENGGRSLLPYYYLQLCSE